MTVISTKITIQGAVGLTQRQRNDVMRKSMEELAFEWLESLLPKHFTKAGAREYGYGARSGESGGGRKFKGSYTDRKLKKYGHARPLELTGEGKREALASRTVKATATKGYGRVTIPLPRKFNFRNSNSKIKMNEEIRAVSSKEMKYLKSYLVGRVAENLRSAGVQVKAVVSR